jgi:nicotinate-nucleotide pyrophosphorylase (carboxylating)
MSGVASMTNAAVKAIDGTNSTIADTRKTLPGLRAIQKYAVTCGGGHNHRYNLSDCAMLKDNHIDAKGGITPAVKALREKIGHTVKIEVETRTLDEVREALSAGADIPFFYPVWYALAVLAVLVGISVLCGVVPIFSLLFSKPAQILAKYDI